MKLFWLKRIPGRKARELEGIERRRFASPEAALQAAEYKIVVAPGYHTSPPDDPPVVGWCLTLQAAESLIGRYVKLPGDPYPKRRIRYEHEPRD